MEQLEGKIGGVCSSFHQQASCYMLGMMLSGIGGASPAGGGDRHSTRHAGSKVEEAHFSGLRANLILIFPSPLRKIDHFTVVFTI